MINDNEEKFFHGFIPFWAIALFSIATLFGVVFILGLVCHWAGCRKPDDHPRSSYVEQPLLVHYKAEASIDQSF